MLPLILSHDAGGVRRRPAATVDRPRILIANGFHRFHLAYLLAGRCQREWDVQLMMGAYPVGAIGAILRNLPLRRSYPQGRLEDGRVGIEPWRDPRADFASESVHGVAAGLHKRAAGIRSAGAREPA